MSLLCVIPGPSKVLRSEPEDRERWCFKCRHRHVHTLELLTDEEPSYYDPIWVRRCPHCRLDYTDFPERSR